MKFVNIACIVIAMFCCHILAQAMTFDFNGTGFAIRNSSGSVANVTSIAPAGFHFDASLTYSAYPAMSGGGIQDGESMGWSAPNTGTGGLEEISTIIEMSCHARDGKSQLMDKPFLSI